MEKMIERLRNFVGRYVRVQPARRKQSFRSGIYIEWWGPMPGHFVVDIPAKEIGFTAFFWDKE